MAKFKGELKGFPKEIVNMMLDYQEQQGNKREIKVFQKERDADFDKKGFDWDLTPEEEEFWDEVILNKNFNLFFHKFPKENSHQAIYRMNRKGIFLPIKHTENQCGKEGNQSYEYLLTIIVKNQLDNKGFIIDHDDLNKAIQECPIYGSCEEMQRLIHKKITEILPEGILLGYKCVIKPLDFTAQAFIEFIECSNPEYFSLL
jgi:hypothetical protein